MYKFVSLYNCYRNSLDITYMTTTGYFHKKWILKLNKSYEKLSEKLGFI